MKKYKSKHRIYTVVVGKRKPYMLMATAAAIVLALALVHFLPKSHDGVYNSFYRLCLDSVLMTKNKADTGSKKNQPFGADMVMSLVSPMFTKTKSTGLAADYTRKEALPEKQAAAQTKNVSEKTIVSQGLSIKNETNYEIDAHALAATPRSYNAAGDKPKVLIIHTHACETYSDKNGKGLGGVGTYRTTDTKKNMVKIGEVINDVFEKNGINVIHDKTLCDYPSYNSSYVKSLGVIEWYMERYPSIEFVFDIHRDAIAETDGTPVKLGCKINGKAAAQAMIVCGTDAMGLSNPYWKDNLILALKIQKNLEEMYPGFMRPVNLRQERFNMHKTKGSLLFEVGTHGNTLEEACLAAECVANGIVQTIK